MKTFDVNIHVRVNSAAKAAQVIRFANSYRNPKNQMTQTAIAKYLGTTVQLVNEQTPAIRKRIKQFA